MGVGALSPSVYIHSKKKILNVHISQYTVFIPMKIKLNKFLLRGSIETVWGLMSDNLCIYKNEFLNQPHNCENILLIKCQIFMPYIYHLTHRVLRILCAIHFQCLDRRILTWMFLHDFVSIKWRLKTNGKGDWMSFDRIVSVWIMICLSIFRDRRYKILSEDDRDLTEGRTICLNIID